MAHDQLQQKCWMHLWNDYPLSRRCAWHTKNESAPFPGESEKQYTIRRSQDKAKGLLPGVLDLTFYWKGVLHIFDIKVGKDKLSDAQIKFIEAIEAQGGKHYVIKEFSTFEIALKQIFNGA